MICSASLEGNLVRSRFPGFDDDDELTLPKSVVTPESASWGLSVSQMRAMGITSESERRRELDPDSLRAVSYYGGEKITAGPRQETTMSAGTGAAPGQVPPDLPSLLLDARICYIGMPLVPAVTELLISELLWLNFSGQDKPVYLYVNSVGSQTSDGQAVAFETEAYALLDTMKYITPDVYTLVIGEAMGNAAMLVASGKKGNRFMLPHARMMTCPPRMNRSFGSTVNMMIRAQDLEYNTQRYVDNIAKYTGKPKDIVRKDVGRNRYFTPKQAIEYGLIDHEIVKKGNRVMEKRDYEGALQQSESRNPRRGSDGGGGPSADSGT